jgi:hypothetical protein
MNGTGVGLRLSALGLALAVAVAAPRAAQGVRVVDSVAAGHPADEAAHHYAGADAVTGTAAGKTWRSATGWFSYSLRIYDDSPLTIVCVLADGDGAGEAFDILVEGAKMAVVTRPVNAKAGSVEVALALGDTKGKTSVVVKLAAHAQSRTARVLEIKTVQEHLE